MVLSLQFGFGLLDKGCLLFGSFFRIQFFKGRIVKTFHPSHLDLETLLLLSQFQPELIYLLLKVLWFLKRVSGASAG